MQNLAFVENLEAPDDLDEDIPDFLFLDIGLPFLVVTDLLKDVSVVGILHDETISEVSLYYCYLPERAARVVYEGFLVRHYVWVTYGSQNSNLIEGVFLLLVGQVEHLDLLKGVDIIVLLTAHLIDTAISSISYKL